MEGGIRMINREHLTPKRIAALKEGLLPREEAVSTLEHIGECEACAELFAESYGRTELLRLSPDFKTSVFLAIEKERISISVKEKTNRNPRRELCTYGFKVSIAACAALLLLFSGTFNYSMDFSRSTIRSNLSEVSIITESIKDFSGKLIEFKVMRNIKEEQ
jgi:hypothetical protein